WCRQTGIQEYDVNLYQQVHFALWEQVIATQLRTEGLHEDRTPVWRLRGLNLPAADSVLAAAQSHHALIKSPAWPCDDQKLSVHWRRKTGIQE
ncbi:hypothetical protein OFN54_26445, partial [Escherichia coli]|nr:hypothetical protein [Escherichia coli]